MKSYQRLCAGIIGLVFGFAGFFKLMDPVGSALIVEAYLKFFHMEFLLGGAKFIAVLLSFAEVVTGTALVCGVFRRMTFWTTGVFLLFFTIVSVILRICNPDMDCGCFGQVVHLSHSQTLLKNVILDILALAAFFPLRNFGSASPRKYVAFGICTLLTLSFTIYSLTALPLVDFTAYKPSNTIVTDDDAARGENGYALLNLWDGDGNDCSDILVTDYVAVISIYDTESLKPNEIATIASFAQDAFNVGFYPVILSSGQVDVPGVSSYLADYKSIITLNRSNGGVALLDDGYIMAKRPLTHLPDFDALEYAYSNDPTEVYIKTSTFRSIILQSYALIVLAVAFLL